MSVNLGYDFYFTIGNEVLTLPITPAEIKISSGSNNKVVTLIDEGEINILKSPSLMEIEFEARFPMREYPYSRWKSSDFGSRGVTKLWESNNKIFEHYFAKFSEAKSNKQPVRFTVVRSLQNGQLTWGTGIDGANGDNLFALEELSTSESADNGDDVIVSFKLKKYKTYGVKTLPNSYLKTPTTTSTSNENRQSESPIQKSETKTHPVKPGDCLWNIAKYYYGSGAKWKTIYNANKTAIENDAKKHGRQSSQEGHWIYPGLVLTIPNA